MLILRYLHLLYVKTLLQVGEKKQTQNGKHESFGFQQSDDAASYVGLAITDEISIVKANAQSDKPGLSFVANGIAENVWDYRQNGRYNELHRTMKGEHVNQWQYPISSKNIESILHKRHVVCAITT